MDLLDDDFHSSHNPIKIGSDNHKGKKKKMCIADILLYVLVIILCLYLLKEVVLLLMNECVTDASVVPIFDTRVGFDARRSEVGASQRNWGDGIYEQFESTPRINNELLVQNLFRGN